MMAFKMACFAMLQESKSALLPNTTAKSGTRMLAVNVVLVDLPLASRGTWYEFERYMLGLLVSSAVFMYSRNHRSSRPGPLTFTARFIGILAGTVLSAYFS